MANIKRRRLAPNERPARIPTARVTLDKKAKERRRCVRKQTEKKEIKEAF